MPAQKLRLLPHTFMVHSLFVFCVDYMRSMLFIDIVPGRDRVPGTDTRPLGHQNILPQRGSQSDETLSGAQRKSVLSFVKPQKI
jgi:hypothetical protein